MANLTNLIKNITYALNVSKTPANILPPMLNKSVSLARPGMSAYKIASEVIKNNNLIGIQTEKNPDGSENVINQFVYNIVKCVVDAIKNDAVVQATVPGGSVLVSSQGGNAGGPISTIGQNMFDSQCTGIIS